MLSNCANVPSQSTKYSSVKFEYIKKQRLISYQSMNIIILFEDKRQNKFYFIIIVVQFHYVQHFEH